MANSVRLESIQTEIRGVIQVRTEVRENRMLGHIFVYQQVKEKQSLKRLRRSLLEGKKKTE